MANANYLAGRRFEYKRKKVWEKAGCTVLRTAGSHGPFDLVAIDRENLVALIQCKIVKTYKEALRLIRQFEQKPPLGVVRYATQYIEVYVRETKGVEQGVV